jgi:protein SCO1/2
MIGSIAIKKRPKNPRQTTRRSALVQGRCARNHSLYVLTLLCSALWACMLFVLVSPASAAMRSMSMSMSMSMPLHGLVLAVEPGRGQVIVRHDAAGGMPGMTMTFSVASPEVMERLRPGQTIEATADTSTEPWALRNVRVVGTENLIEEQADSSHLHSVIRNVKQLVVGDLVPNGSFIDQSGKPFTFARLRGENVVAAFIYTRCRDPRMCPLISSKFHRLQALLRETNTHLVEISLDPTFDRPSVLTKYSHVFGVDPRRWTLLTGDLDRTLDFAARFDVSALPDPRYGILHSERTVLIDAQGIIRVFLDDTAWSPEEIVAEIRAIDHQQSNPFLRFNLWLSAQAAAMCGNRAAGFSGIADLLVVLGILGGSGWLLYRLACGIFRS